MKICLINTLYPPHQVGGAERSVQILAESLAQLGHQLVVLTLGQQDEQYVQNSVQVIRKTLKNSYWPFDGKSKSPIQKISWHTKDIQNNAMGEIVGSVLDAEQPDVVHTNNLSGFSVTAWTAAKERRIRLIHTLRDYYLLCYKTSMYKGNQNCIKQCLDCRAVSIAKKSQKAQPDYVVGISEYILRRHLDMGFFENAQHAVVFNSYDAPQLEGTPIVDRPFTFGYIGRLAESKGIESLIRAFRKVSAQTNVTLKIAGKGDPGYVSELQRLASDLPISFVGHTELPSFFASLDATVVPSLWHEPLGRVVIESYAFGVPVIAASTGALPEIVSPQVTGYLYDHEHELVERMTQMINLSTADRQALSQACKHRAKEQFSSASIVNQYLALYTGQA